jgi:Uma2 family endonuclease
MRVQTLAADEPIGPMTFDEFLAFEQQAEFKHEFVDGYAYPHGDWATGLAGAGTRHNRIASQLIRLLGNAAEGRPACFVYGADQMLYIGDLGKGYYPDIQLVCDAGDQHPDYSTRPCLIVEVLSRNTARIDRGEKLKAYQGIQSLQAYWIVSQQAQRVTRWWRSTDLGTWREDEVTAGELPIPCLGIGLQLEAVYARA